MSNALTVVDLLTKTLPVAYTLALLAASACVTERAPDVVPEPARRLVSALSSQAPLVETGEATALGLVGLSANGRVHPRGRPARFRFEYGPTTAYGATTPTRDLGPQLAAHYHETWDEGLGGFRGGMSGSDLRRRLDDGASGGHARYREPGPAGDDNNHIDGVGTVHLAQYLYAGTYRPEEGLLNAVLGGGAPDLRDARIEVDVRGTVWTSAGTDLVFWFQNDLDLMTQNDTHWRRANWALTGTPLTAHLASGQWEHVTYSLPNDTRAWSYAGNAWAAHRPNYVYMPLDESLANVNTNFFHMLTYVDPYSEPQGKIDFDELTVTYRNHNLLRAQNGGRLVSEPAPDPTWSEDSSRLTDGWRFGEGRDWKTPPYPAGPQELVYELAHPVSVRTVQLHQHSSFPAKRVEVLVSEDGQSWTAVLERSMKASAIGGANFNFVMEQGLDVRARWVKVRLLSGYYPEFWGLGEIEVFGDGAVMETDDDWYNVNADIRGLAAGQEVHYRLVVESDGQTTFGRDVSYVVPPDTLPLVETRRAREIGGGRATVEGRINPMGRPTWFRFEWGQTINYGKKTARFWGGRQITPRHATRELSDLIPGKTYHYRIFAWNAAGTTVGEDKTFVAE
jgi:hypothetical protein